MFQALLNTPMIREAVERVAAATCYGFAAFMAILLLKYVVVQCWKIDAQLKKDEEWTFDFNAKKQKGVNEERKVLESERLYRERMVEQTTMEATLRTQVEFAKQIAPIIREAVGRDDVKPTPLQEDTNRPSRHQPKIVPGTIVKFVRDSSTNSTIYVPYNERYLKLKTATIGDTCTVHNVIDNILFTYWTGCSLQTARIDDVVPA